MLPANEKHSTTRLLCLLSLGLILFVSTLRTSLQLDDALRTAITMTTISSTAVAPPATDATTMTRSESSPVAVRGLTYQETWNATSVPSSREMTQPESLVPPVDAWLIDSPLRNQTSIPKIMYKAVLSHGGTFPNFINQTIQLRAAHESWMLRNPGYEVRYFDLVTMRHYVRSYFHPVFLRAFDCIVPYAGKADFFRVLILYREGGWYSDWKEVCLEDHLLDALSENNRTIVFGWDRGTPHARQNTCVMNAFLGATERHPMFEDFLRRVLLNVQAAHYGATPQSNTGPCVLGEAYLNVMEGNHALKRSMMTFKYQWNFYYFKSKKVIQHKCDDCGSWGTIGGNEYRDLHETRGYYCPESPSILLLQ